MAGSNFTFNNPRLERIVSGPGALGKLPRRSTVSALRERWLCLTVGNQDVLARADQVQSWRKVASRHWLGRALPAAGRERFKRS
jgi:hypothetical protein